MEHIKLICFRQVSFSWDPSPIIYLPCKSLWRSLLFFNFAQIVGFVKVVRRISLKLLHGFVKIDTWISLSCYMDLSKLKHGFLDLLHGFVNIDTLLISLICYLDFYLKIDTWISHCCFLDLSISLHGSVKVVTWICQSFLCVPRYLPNKTKLKFDQDFKASALE